MSWSDYTWVAFGDSLTDGAINASTKYHKIIHDSTGIPVTDLGVGGTGYWRTEEKGSCFYQRLSAVAADSSVDLVTIFGSVNDAKIWRTTSMKVKAYWDVENLGIGKDGTTIAFSDVYNNVNNNWTGGMTKENILRNLRLDDTVESTAGCPVTSESKTPTTWVAYVNEAINYARSKYPNAKVVLLNELRFKNTSIDGTRAGKAVKEALVEYRVSQGDNWLSLVKLNESTYAGIDDPSRKYVNIISGMGLSFEQMIPDNADNLAFRAYYTTDNGGHPNDLYHRIWLAPIFAHIVSTVTGEAITDPALTMSADEQAALDALWINKPDGDGPDTPPETYETRIYDAARHEVSSLSRLRIRHGGRLVQPSRVFDSGKHEINIGG